MPKKPPYIQQFREEWLKDEELKDWIQKVPTDKTKVRCRFCQCLLSCKYSGLRDHSKSEKHVKAAKPFSCARQSKLNFLPKVQSLTTARAEAGISLFVSVHCAIQCVDHLSELSKHCFQMSDLKIHRTKCSEVIKNVLYPHFKLLLKNDIGDSSYSILVDESTDIAVTKQLGVCILYFSESKGCVVSTFLKLLEIESGNATTIVESVKAILADFGLDLQKMRGIGTDNASVMVGKDNGVYALLKREIPHLILIPCSCHSMQLALSHSCKEELPAHLDFIFSETHNWFHRSSIRQKAYNDLYNTLYDEDPLKIMQIAGTRWLSIEPVCERILNQWEALTEYFREASVNEKCYTAQTLYKMYKDCNNKLFLIFLRPILRECNVVNKALQSRSADPTKLLQDLTILIKTLAQILVVKGCQEDLLSINVKNFLNPKPHLGSAFEMQVEILRKSGRITLNTEMGIREICIKFLVRLVSELQSRLPKNVEVLRMVSSIAPENCLRRIKSSITSLAMEMGIRSAVLSDIDLQWQKINFVEWENVTDTVQFWSEVSKYEDASKQKPFSELCNLAKILLVLPWSNAEVERCFSEMNIAKTSHRNRMGNAMLNSILTIRAGLRRLKKCCHNFQFEDSVLKNIGKMQNN